MTTSGTPRRARSVSMILAAAAAFSLSSAALAQDVKEPQTKTLDIKPTAEAPKQPAGALAAATAPPPLQFDSMTHDWGRQTDVAPLKHTFKFTNISDQTVTIRSVTATCGCTVPQLTKKIYAPGETGEIEVSFNPKNRRGPQSKQVTITFDGDTYAPMRLDLSSHILPMLWVEPNRVLFQDNYKGTGGTQQVVVTARNPDFEITSMEGMEQYFSAKVIGSEVAEEDGDQVRKITLEVTLDKEAPIGSHNTQLIFKSNEPSWPEFKIFATAIVVGELKADPPSALIRTQQPNTPFESLAIIETRNSKEFEIDSVDWTIDGGQDLSLVVDWEDYSSTRGRPTYLLRISGVTPPNTGQVRATIKVKAKIAGMEDEEIPVVIWGTIRGAQPAGGMPAPMIMPDGQTSVTPVKPTTQAPVSTTPQKQPEGK